jgi:hypothetical protein
MKKALIGFIIAWFSVALGFAQQGNQVIPSGGSGGLAFVASLPATCTPGVTASVQLSVSPYTINYCSALNTWTAVGRGTVTSVTGTANQIASTGGTTPVLSLPSLVNFPGQYSTVPGIDPTGTNDSTSAINAVLASTGYVLLPCGTFKITPATLSINSGALIQGSGSGMTDPCTQLVSAASGVAISVPEGVGNVTFRDIALTCSSTVGSTGMVLGGTENSNWAVQILLDNVAIQYCGRNLMIENAWGIELRHVFLTHSITDYNLYLHPPVGGYTTTILVDGNSELDNAATSGLYTDGLNNSITIEDSIIDSSGATDVLFTGTAGVLRFERNWIENSIVPIILSIPANYITQPTNQPDNGSSISGNILYGTEGYSIGANPGMRIVGNNGIPDSLGFNTTAQLTDISTVGVLGANLVTNSTFASSGTGWTAQTGWTLSTGASTGLNVTGGSSTYQTISCSTGQLIKIVTVIGTQSKGLFAITLGSNAGYNRAAAGTYTDYIPCIASGSQDLYLQGFNDFTGTVTNVTAYVETQSQIGTVTSVTGTAPVTSTGGTTPAIGCATCETNGGTPLTSGTIPRAGTTPTLVNGSLSDNGTGTLTGLGANTTITAGAGGGNLFLSGGAGDVYLATNTVLETELIDGTGTQININQNGNLLASGTITLSGVTTGTNADFLCMSSGKVVLLQTSACTISSVRFKQNIHPLYSAMGEIMKLKPVTFNKIRDEEHPDVDVNAYVKQIGLTAENVASVDPKAAIYEQDGVTPKSYRQESIIALLVKATQEQQKEIADLRDQVRQLAAR